MRIWIVNHYALPPDSAGGTRHHALARALQKRGHEVLIVAASYNHFTHDFMCQRRETGRPDTSRDVPFLWLHARAYQGNSVKRFLNMLDFSWRVSASRSLRSLPAPDIVMGSSPHLFAAFGAMRFARKRHIPFVLEIRDIWPDSLTDLGKMSHRHPLIRLMKWTEHQLYRHADRVVTLLPGAGRYLEQHGVRAEHVLWLPNAVEINHLQKTAPVSPSSQKFTFMYAGAHGLANDLKTVLQAGKILQEKGYGNRIRICLAGNGPEKQVLQEMARREKLYIVEFKKPVPKKDIYTLLNEADVFLMLLKKSPVFRWGISPNKLFDYMAMGRPVIFGVETPVDPVTTCRAGISIAPSDPAALAKGMEALLQLPAAERAAMGQRARDYVATHHDMNKLAGRLEGFLADVHCKADAGCNSPTEH